MSSEIIAPPPSVLWAQGNAQVYLTFNVECEKPDILIEKRQVYFKGICAPEQKLYEVKIPLYSEIDPEKSSHVNKGRNIEIVLAKEKPDEAYWPSLTSDRKKHHWLRVDFDRWHDEDGSGDECDNSNDMFSIDEDYRNESSSNDEEDLPDIQ